MRHEQVKLRESFDVIDVAEISAGSGAAAQTPLAEVEVGLQRSPTPAVPDMPVAVGRMIITIYGGLIAILFATMARSGEAAFMVTVSGLYVVIFLGVPCIFFAVEKDASRRPDLQLFLKVGVDTFTGRMSGSSALAQMFVVPVLLTFTILAMGLIGLWFV